MLGVLFQTDSMSSINACSVLRVYLFCCCSPSLCVHGRTGRSQDILPYRNTSIQHLEYNGQCMRNTTYNCCSRSTGEVFASNHRSCVCQLVTSEHTGRKSDGMTESPFSPSLIFISVLLYA